MTAAAAKPRSPRRNRDEVPLDGIRERDAGNGQTVRMVKIRMDGPVGRRWIPFARWWWERNRGPVPAGRRICHADGNLLNDAPDNLVALTPGEVFNLYHKLDPEMSRRNRAACGAHAAKRNVETGRRRRATQWLTWFWYAVDFEAKVIHNQPRRKRWMVYEHHGFAERLADRLRDQIASARQGDVVAATYVFDQVEKLATYAQWIRSSSLGWPGINCMTACILAVLADAGGPMPTSELIAAVNTMRELYEWTPHELQRGVMASCVSTVRQWISSSRGGVHETHYRILPAAIAARLPGPRIVPVRGRLLQSERFADFKRVEPAGEASERVCA